MPRTTSQSRQRDDFLRHAAGVLVCPRCAVPLQGGDHELGIAWRCDSCRGQSLNFSQFRRLVPEEGARDIWLEAMKRPIAPPQRTCCPECRAAMHAVLIPFRGRNVELDICLPCQRLWMDAQEEEAAAMLPAISCAPHAPGAGRGLNSADTEAILTALERREHRQLRHRQRTWRIAAIILSLGSGITVFLLARQYPPRPGRPDTDLVLSLMCAALVCFACMRRKI